jgi:hypothetical protein
MPTVRAQSKYPPNSHRAQVEGEERVITPEVAGNVKIDPSVPSGDTSKKLVKVTKGMVIKKKKSWLDKFANTFLGDDAKNVGSYIMWDVLIPAAKDTIVDMIKGGIEMLVYGEGRRGERIGRDRDRSVVLYNKMYRGERDRDRDEPRHYSRGRSDSRQRTDDVVFTKRTDAEETLDKMVDVIDEYNTVSLAEFYDLVGLPSEFVHNNWGWDNLSRAEVIRTRYGYALDLPEPKALD